MQSEAQKLFAEVEMHYREHLWVPNDYAFWLATAWVGQSHLRDISGNFLPHAAGRLGWFSKLPGAAKTLGLDLTCAMSYNGGKVLNPTPPSIITMLHLEKNTVGFDEFDRYFGRGTGNNAMRTIVDGGYTNDAEITKQRQDEVVRENIGGPMVLAGKNYQRFTQSEAFDTTRTRTFVILMEEAPDEVVDDLYEFDYEHGAAMLRGLSRRLTKYFRAHAREIVSLDVELPRGIKGRNKQIWKPLFQIAQHVGGEWPDRIERAAKAMVLGIHETDQVMVDSAPDELLNWVKAVFREDESQLASETIVQRLLALPGNHWWKVQWVKSERAATMSLSRNLLVNGITHTKLRIGDSTPWGYTREDLNMPDAEEWNYVNLDG